MLLILIGGGFTWNHAGNPDDPTYLPDLWRKEVRSLNRIQGVARSGKGEWIAVGGGPKQAAIWVLDDDGDRQDTWLSRQGKRLQRPGDLAVVGDRVWISDHGSHRIWWFDRARRRHRHFGGYGSEAGRLNQPTGLWWDDRRLWVADRGNRRLQRFDEQGRQLDSLTAFDAKRSFAAPTAVTGDGQGRFFVADAVHQQIAVLDRDGQPQAVIGDYGFFPGLIDQPSDLLWDGRRLLVLETRNHRLQAFDPEGRSLWLWGAHEIMPHEGRGKFHYPNHFAVDPRQGRLVIAEALEDRLQYFDWKTGGQAPTYDPESIQSGRFHFGPYLDTSGPLMITADVESHDIRVYDIRGEMPINLHRFGERGSQYGLMRQTRGVAIDPQKKVILACDSANQRLQIFSYQHDPNEELKQLPEMTRFSRAFSFTALQRRGSDARADYDGVFVAPDGAYWFIDPRHHCLRIFTADWQKRAVIGSFGAGPNHFNHPTDVAFAAEGTWTAVVDQNNRRVVILDSKGKVKHRFGRKHLIQPFGVAIGKNGAIYVSDQARHQILVFNVQGRLRQVIGEQGVGMGQFWQPADIDRTEDGRLVVIDQGNHRLQLFDEDGRWLVTMAISGTWTHRFPPPKPRTKPKESR